MNPPAQLKCRQSFQVASWDVDARNRLTTGAMGRFMQEAAETSASDLGAGFADLARLGQTWVLTGLLIQVRRSPRFRDRITVETWPRDIVRRRALRDFCIYDDRDQLAAAATSAWACLDLTSRRPVPPDPWRTTAWLTEDRALDREGDRLPPLAAPWHETAVPVRWGDLDLVGHLTNTRYQEILLESYPADWLQNRTIAEIELNFLAEGQYPDTVLSRRQEAVIRPETWLHSLVRTSDGAEICRATITWR